MYGYTHLSRWRLTPSTLPLMPPFKVLFWHRATSALVKESASPGPAQTAPGSSTLNDEDTHSDLIDEVDEAIPLPERSGTATHARDTSHPPALLELFNYPIAIFRGSLYGFTPADRERANEARLDRFLEEEYVWSDHH